VAQTLRFWVDLLFGDKQRNPTYSNVFYAYAYEYYVRLKQNEMEDHHIDTINEFMQMPMALFTEPIFKVDKKKEALMLQSQQLQVIPEESEYGESSRYEDNIKTPLIGAKGDRMQSQAVMATKDKNQQRKGGARGETRTERQTRLEGLMERGAAEETD